MRRNLRALFLMWGVSVFSVNSFSQESVTVSGRVLDNVGNPVVGAAVVVEGTSTGTVTDADGNYSLSAPAGSTLWVSFLGYESSSVTAVGGAAQDVTLFEEDNELEELIVMGYGIQKKSDVTSSISTVQSDELNAGVFSTSAELLQGKVPGLVVTQDANPNNQNTHVTLRGASTLRSGAAQEPYYVIDGVPGLSLRMVSPDDIESIDILRDASATAIYGSKGANGVIIITTKKGRADQTEVRYAGSLSVSRVAKQWDMMDASEYREWCSANGKAIVAEQDLGADTDWQDEVQRTGVAHSHSLAIAGSSEKSFFNASFNYTKNNGVMKGTDMEHFVGRASVETKTLHDKLTLGLTTDASLTKRNDIVAGKDGLSVYDAMTYYIPTAPVKNEDGSWYEYLSLSQNYNPLALIKERTDFSKHRDFLLSGKAVLDIVDGLDYNFNLSYQGTQDNYNYYNSSLYAGAQGANGQASRISVDGSRLVMETYLNYKRTFGGVHSVGALVGYSWEENNDNDGIQVTASDFYDDSLGYYNLGMSNYNQRNDYGGYLLSTLRMISFYGRVNYGYAGKYLLQATIRRDGSSAFGENNRWATFPSFSAAWRLGEEDFIKNTGAFDDLKVRLGYGVSGNSLGFDVFSARQLYGGNGWTTDGSGKEIQSLGPTRNANPDLKWERTSMFNVGLDFTVLGGRLGGTVEYYSKKTEDLIADYAVSTSKYLYGWMTTNVGEISNKGVELTIDATPVKSGNWRWDTTLNLSHNKNKVVKISSDEYSVAYMDQAWLNAPDQTGIPSQRIMEGEPIGTFFTYEWAGYSEDGISQFYVHDETTGERVVNEDGSYAVTTKPEYKDRAKTGCAQPKITFGWNNTVSWKRWSLSAFFAGVGGNDILDGTRARLSRVADGGSRNLLADVADREKATDINSHFLSDRYLENGTYVRLKTLSLSYGFGAVGSWVNDLRLSLTANNLFTLTGYEGADPEVTLGGIAPGVDNRNGYPSTRQFIFSVNANF